MQRTPPQNNASCLSETEVLKAQVLDKRKNLTKRQKRRRGSQEEDSCKETDVHFKEEIFAKIESWKADQEAILKKLCDDINEVKLQNTSIQKANAEMKNSYGEIEKSLNFISQRYEELNNVVSALQKEKRETMDYVRSLEEQIEDLHKNQRSTMLEFRNIPSSLTKSQSDCIDIVTKSCDAIQEPIKPSDIKNIIRISGKQNKESSTILVDFPSTIFKNKILEKLKNFNRNKTSHNKFNSSHIGLACSTTPIYIAESLTPKTRKLFFLTRTFANEYHYKYCWTSNGRVFLRKEDNAKQALIKNEHQLLSLKNSL
ncbi:unnamed protein product [Colias eurytheme]|nr:unnamed protein product [Colias eurytheme]CAG4980520.1 unnamed protein product [Colias eurytheme]